MSGKRILGLAGMAAWLAGGLAHPAAAMEPATDRSTVELRVSTSGLDLTKAADQALLRHRIAVAASKLCAMVNHTASLTDEGYDACFQKAAAEARRQADAQIAALQSKAIAAAIAP
jgi:UrcA family protein